MLLYAFEYKVVIWRCLLFVIVDRRYVGRIEWQITDANVDGLGQGAIRLT